MTKWTKDQEAAIYSKWRDAEKTKSANILVNAAAGSGKTAVLVERIINKITSAVDSPDHAGIDSLLVVTFTNAAAKEMQQRIFDALMQKQNEAVYCNDQIAEKNLREQMSLLNNADIMTIDAFCLKTIRNYFHLLNIDPEFKIIDSEEGAMLVDEAMEKLYEDCYGEEEFTNLVCMYSDSRDDSGLAEIIKKIYRFTRNQPDPHEWLYDKAKYFSGEICNDVWFETILKSVRKQAISAKKIVLRALGDIISYCYMSDDTLSEEETEKILEENPPETDNELYQTFGTVYKVLYTEYFYYKNLSVMSWDEIYEFNQKIKNKELSFENIASKVKNIDGKRLLKDKEILEPIKALRSNAKDIYTKKISKSVLSCSNDISEIAKEKLFPVISSLIKYVLRFEEIYENKKSLKNVMEFSDIEHLCLKLFREYPEVANEFKNKYSEILMDEYQDSNFLQEAIFNLISDGDNLFMVGDMKQSIYRFRSSDPDLFKYKCDTYSKSVDAAERKIILSQNFRSREEILEGVNSVFSAIMSDDVGGIEYDSDQRLNYGDITYENVNKDNCGGYKNECYVLLGKNSENDDEAELESIDSSALQARFIAKKIKEMKDNKYLVRYKKKIKKTDEEGNETEETVWDYRPVQNRDFVILMSSYRNVSKIYLRELSRLGIDCYAHTDGYFDRLEIRLILSILKAINNPYNDVSLIAVMRSFVFGFSDDELAVLRKYSDEKFYDCVLSAIEKNDEPALSEKCVDLTEKLAKWRKYSSFMSSDRFIWTLYEETNVYSFMQAVYGEDAAANLILLFNKAKQYEKSGYKGIFNFIRYIEKIRKSEEKVNSAIITGESSDVVRIMTIHKSKGLEFPVVFLTEASKKFNMRDTSGHLILHKDLGFGMNYIDFEESSYINTLSKTAVAEKIKEDSVSEEVRKLYVAMTRAKEKLIVVSAAKSKITSASSNDNIPAEYDKWIDSYDKKTKKIYPEISAIVGNFIDWIAPVAIADGKYWDFKVLSYSDIMNNDDADIVGEDIEEENNAENINISENKYRYLDEVTLPVKISVTEINKMKERADMPSLSEVPIFMQNDMGLTGAERGTAIHYVMQKYIPTKDMSIGSIGEFINKLEADEELTHEEAKAVDPKMIYEFYMSELGQRIIKSEKVVREASFEFEVPASEIFDTSSNENILVQGIIDCYFYEGDEIVIVDYKSDNCNNFDEITQKYALQIKYYKTAIEKICKKSVKNSFLYLFFNKSMIQY